MKELSVEEKAKRYDEAIDVCRKLYNRAKADGYTSDIEDYEQIFPELTKSEDERIRKWIIGLLSTYEHDRDLRNAAIAWLEKQKTSEEALEYLKHNHSPSEVSDFQAAMNIAVKKAFDEGKKQGEQKLTDAKEYDFHGIKFIPKFAKGDIIKDKKRGEVSTIEGFSYDTGLYTHTYGQFPITIQDNYEIIAQKPAWSEEDEINLEKAIWYVENPAPMVVKDSMLVEWLKNIRGRVQPQHKQEWSEEDEAMWAEISDLLWEGYKQSGSKFSWDDIRNWVNPKLKSLRPQNHCNWNDMSVKPIYPCNILYQHPNGNIFLYRYLKGGRKNDAQTTMFCNLDENGKWIYLKDVEPQPQWKPSDEQMEILQYLCETSSHPNEKVIPTLESIYQDLKKLREE